MKKLLSVVAIVAVFISVAHTRSQDVSVNFFYDNLDGGSWIEVGDYGYCWQPDVAVNDSSWRPYADGYWAYTDEGWTWVSYEDFGWATYHYGRWVKLADYGWIWKPGYEWGPAWVSWRTGGNYIGWAPLPPETEYVYESRPLTGHLDVEFDIGPAYYNFCDVRYIGEPVLRSRLVPYQQNVTYITQTVNVTNITYKNKTVYNYGPDVNVVNQYSSRPIQRLKLERQANVDSSAAARSGGLTKVQGNALVVAVPTRLNTPGKEIVPPRVKTKLTQSKIEKGWSEVGDANAQTQLKEKFKAEDSKNVPPPTLGASNASPGAPRMSPGVATGASPFEKGKDKNKNKAAEQMQAAGPAGAEMSPVTSPVLPEGGKKKGKHAEQNQPGAMTSPLTGAATEGSPGGMPESGKPGKGKNRRYDQFGATPPATGAAASPEGMTVPEGKAKHKGFERQNLGPAPTGTTSPMENPNEPPRGKQKGFERQNVGPAPGGGASPIENMNEPRVGKQKRFEQQNVSPPPGGNTPIENPNEARGGKQRRFEQQPPPGTVPGNAVSGSGPQGPIGGEGRGNRKVESAAGPATGEPAGANQPGGERKHEGKAKAPVGTPTPGQQ